jgi:Leucine-rich repeat (LRR) protein
MSPHPGSFAAASADLERLCFQEMEETCAGLENDELEHPSSVPPDAAAMVVRSFARIGIEKCLAADYLCARAYLCISLDAGIWQEPDDDGWRDEALFYLGWALEHSGLPKDDAIARYRAVERQDKTFVVAEDQQTCTQARITALADLSSFLSSSLPRSSGPSRREAALKCFQYLETCLAPSPGEQARWPRTLALVRHATVCLQRAQERRASLTCAIEAALAVCCATGTLGYQHLMLCAAVSRDWRCHVEAALPALRCLDFGGDASTLDASLVVIRSARPPSLRPLWPLPELERVAIVSQAFAALRDCAGLETVDMSSIGTLSNEASEAILRAVRQCPRLDVSLVNLAIPNMGAGALRLTTLVEGFSALRRLDLAGNYLGDEGALVLAKALQSSTSLESLSLEQNNLGAEAVRVLAPVLASIGLRELLLAGNNVGDRGCGLLLASALPASLVALDLRSNGLTATCGPSLALLLSGSSLERVLLGRKVGWSNRIGGAFRVIAVGLQSLQLTLLDLTRLALSSHDCQLLALVLQGMPRMRHLHLSGVLTPGAAAKASAAPHPAEDPDATAVDNGSLGALPWVLGSCMQLVYLDLSRNGLDDASCTALAAGLSRAPRLEFLDLGFNRLCNEACFALRAAGEPAGAREGAADPQALRRAQGCFQAVSVLSRVSKRLAVLPARAVPPVLFAAASVAEALHGRSARWCLPTTASATPVSWRFPLFVGVSVERNLEMGV